MYLQLYLKPNDDAKFPNNKISGLGINIFLKSFLNILLKILFNSEQLSGENNMNKNFPFFLRTLLIDFMLRIKSVFEK